MSVYLHNLQLQDRLPKADSLFLKRGTVSEVLIASGRAFQAKLPRKKTEFAPYLIVLVFGKESTFETLRLKGIFFLISFFTTRSNFLMNNCLEIALKVIYRNCYQICVSYQYFNLFVIDIKKGSINSTLFVKFVLFGNRYFIV